MKFSARALPLLVALATMTLPAFVNAEPIKFARYPHVAGGRLVFSYHGDIWIASQDGTNPTRLTAHVARDSFPRFSPDGKLVAFSSNRMGNDDVFVMSAAGGEPRQLTFNTTGDTVLSWSPDGAFIVFASQRSTSPWRSPLYKVPVGGGLPIAMDMDTGNTGMIKQDGSTVAFTRLGGSYWRKGYRGNRADDIWIQDLRTKKITQLTDANLKEFKTHTQDTYPMWGADGMIYFASERSDIFNIWKIADTGGSPAQVTFHKEDGVQFPSISPDGKVIAYENEFELWTVDVPSGSPKKVTIDMAFDPKDNLITWTNVRNRAEGFAPNHEGDYLVVDQRGEIFIVPTDSEVGEKTQVTDSAWRDQGGMFSPDGRFIAYLSDQSKEQEVWVFDRTANTRRKLSAHASFKELGFWSPDSKKIAYGGGNRLFMADVDSGASTELAYNQAGGYQLSGFSPDGKWLVYTKRDDDQNAEVFLMEIATKVEHNATANPFADSRGTVTPDGTRLIFLSDRDGGVTHLFSVPLLRQNEDPDDPLVKERLKKARPERREQNAPPSPPPPAAVRVEPEGIGRRAVQITRGEQAIQTYFLSADGRLIYFRSTDERGPGFFSINIDGTDRKRVTEGAFDGLVPSGDRRKVFYTQENEIWQMEMTSERRKSRVVFALAVKVDQRAEWEQILDEAWRVMKYRFYDEKMHGRDWVAIKRKYEPLLKYVGENQDVYDLANEMIGELNASHTGVSGPPSREMPDAYTTRHPGFEMSPENGYYRVSHIYRDGPADKEWIDLKKGDYVLAVDGKPIKAGDNYWQLLNSPLNDYVTITAASAPPSGNSTAGERKMRIKTSPSLTDVKYRGVGREEPGVRGQGVERPDRVRAHPCHEPAVPPQVPERDQPVLEQEGHRRRYPLQRGRQYRSGAARHPRAPALWYWNNRWGSRTWGRRPRQAIAGPKVMLINHRSGSDSEVTPMGFRDLGLGKIVGNPTSGGVIATGSYRLINGGTIRTPGSLVVTYDPTKPNNYGINLENYGVPPDVWVENTPEDELGGFDRELKTAVDEALRMLKEGRWQFTTEQQDK